MSKDKINTNSVLLTILILLSGWTLWSVHNLSISAGKIETEIVNIKEDKELNRTRDKEIGALQSEVSNIKNHLANND